MPGAPVVAAKTAVVLVFCLIVADAIGVIVCTLFDIAPIRAKSALLPYAIWLVLGIFCGLSAYQGAGARALAGKEGEWTDRAGAFRAGNVIVVTGATILAALLLLFRHLYWTAGFPANIMCPTAHRIRSCSRSASWSQWPERISCCFRRAPPQ